jgi:hypothetical protein
MYINVFDKTDTGTIHRIRCKILKSFTVFQSRSYCLYTGCQEIALFIDGSTNIEAIPHKIAMVAATSLKAASCCPLVGLSLEGVPFAGI